jgi:hypothetical protein
MIQRYRLETEDNRSFASRYVLTYDYYYYHSISWCKKHYYCTPYRSDLNYVITQVSVMLFFLLLQINITENYIEDIILAYFPKTKIGLSNHQYVCLSLH